MKILIFINFIIIIFVYSDNNAFEIKKTTIISNKCYNNLNFNFTINLTGQNIKNIQNITGTIFNVITNEENEFTCKNLSANEETLICKFNDSLENGIYNFSTLEYIINDGNEEINNIDDLNVTFNYAKNYAPIDEILTQNQTIQLDKNHYFKIIFETMNVDKYNYIIELVNDKSYKFTEENITCNFGIMYINLNLIGNNYFNLKENETKNFSVNITNPCHKKENFNFYITLNRSCVNCTIESELLSNQPNYTNPFFDESFNIFKSNFSLILNILLLLFI